MMQSSNKVLLKIRKKSTSTKPKCDKTPDVPVNINVLPQRKRPNPFSQESIKKVHQSNENACEEKSNLLNKLSSIEPSEWSVDKTLNCVNKLESGNVLQENTTPEEDENDQNETRKWEYSGPTFPLDWSIKQKIQVVSRDPLTFCSNIKSLDKAVGVKMFANNDNKNPQFYQQLCCWIYPYIPGIRNFPLKKTIGEQLFLGLKDIGSTSDINTNNAFQEAILQQWKSSFQSLFNMLKSKLCPYFYLCGHQFSVLFKAAGLCSDNIKVIVTPTTKGLRSMLKEEDIPFTFTFQNELDTSNTQAAGDDKNVNLTSDFEYDADSFLDSLGLNKDTHFPNIEEQRKLFVKSELKRLDNRPESTVEINDSQTFFNFLLNSPLLCATSGRMGGIPPTLLSPTVFEGAACHVNKYHIGKIKQRIKSSEIYLNCLDIYGFILPTNLKGIVDLHMIQSNELQIRTKGFENLFAFNTAFKTESSSADDDKNEFLSQSSHSIPDQSEIKLIDNLFKF